MEAEGLNVILNSSFEAGLFVGNNVVLCLALKNFHLQFVDDTLILGDKSYGNIRAL
jgi:hypothetical protein